jgi:nucleoid DNA-binding protein
MKNIHSCIAYLISENDCVIIPGFGGFVVHYEAAKYFASEGIFMPPVHTTAFNAALNHNDGLLINTLMRIEKTDYKTARTKVRQYVDHIRSKLNTANEITFPEIGKLTLSPDGQMNFVPYPSMTSNISMYGFSDFRLPTIEELTTPRNDTQHQEKSDNHIHIFISKRLLKSVACAAAIVLAFLTVSTPINNTDIPAQYAAIIDLSAKPKNSAQRKVSISKIYKKLPEKTNDSIPAQPVSSSPMYYIIVGSSPKEQLAKKILLNIRKELTGQAAILAKDGLFRVYVAQFSDRQTAQQYLTDLRSKHPRHKSAWMLTTGSE